MRSWFLAIALVLVPLAASAKAPEGVVNTPEISEWFRSLMRNDTNTSCCNESDCRKVEARINNKTGLWEVYIKPGTGEGEFNVEGLLPHWVEIPADTVLIRDNPTGQAVVCWTPTRVYCFIPQTMS